MINTLFGPNRNCTHHLLLILALSVLRAGATERWEVLLPPHPLREVAVKPTSPGFFAR
jgi:hypothetical protein